MRVGAKVVNSKGRHEVELATDGNAHSIPIPPKETGFGSSANGGELLFLALATCYCNDIYREAARRGLRVERVEVEVDGEFGAAGEPARNVSYRAKVTSPEDEGTVRELVAYTDTVAEIQNTLRAATRVELRAVEVVQSGGTLAARKEDDRG